MDIGVKTFRCSWSRLPAELQLMILEELRDSGVPRTILTAGGWRSRSAYPAVCREWQSFFEQASFKRLILHQSDIDQFDGVVRGQRRLFVKWIWLRLELAEYDCEKCELPESAAEARAHNVLFTRAVWGLFMALASWRDGPVKIEEGSITLELSAHSPSDSLHFFKELQSQERDTAWEFNKRNIERRHKDDAHGWMGRWQRNPPEGAKLRVFGHPRGLAFDMRVACAIEAGNSLPKVNVVRSLVIRRHFYRHISVSKALQPIIGSLPELRCFRYERWRGIDTKGIPGNAIRDEENRLLFSDVFKGHPSLRDVSIFEEFSSIYDGRRGRAREPSLGQALAVSSQPFTHLHAALNVDAKDFFDVACASSNGMAWENLETLSLTCDSLVPGRYDELIRLASRILPKMPKLSPETMACWREVTSGLRDDLVTEWLPLKRRYRWNHVRAVGHLFSQYGLLQGTSIKQIMTSSV